MVGGWNHWLSQEEAEGEREVVIVRRKDFTDFPSKKKNPHYIGRAPQQKTHNKLLFFFLFLFMGSTEEEESDHKRLGTSSQSLSLSLSLCLCCHYCFPSSLPPSSSLQG